jgi:hypothetical protein
MCRDGNIFSTTISPEYLKILFALDILDKYHISTVEEK